MAPQRVLGAIGRTMMAAGALILLFVMYQLFGTGYQTTAHQNELRDTFEARKSELSRSQVSTSSSTTVTTTPGTDATGPTTAPATTAPAPTPPPLTPPKPGEPIGVIRIPKIGVDYTVIEGVSLADLAKGPGHFPSTPLPGQPGNAAIAGHRVTHSAPFNRIDELVPGDKISVETLQGEFTYTVIPEGGVGDDPNVGHRIITPGQTEILDPFPGQNTLTLMACHPKYDLKQRIVVVGRLDDPPAPAPAPVTEVPGGPTTAPGPLPPDEAPPTTAVGSPTTLVDGDASAVGPAVVFGMTAGFVWVAAWLIARSWPRWRQWQRWAVFAVAVPVFAIPLIQTFEHVSRMLPAGY